MSVLSRRNYDFYTIKCMCVIINLIFLFILIFQKEALHQLDRSRLISVSMDGPNVNWKLFDLLQQEHAQLVSVGSCGLHTLHNAFKAGFSMWNVDKILKAMHTLFHNVPARREDYEQVTKSTFFPKPFCGHRWLENLPVIERALAVWPSLMLYVDAVHK